jgi:hypothetical protein
MRPVTPFMATTTALRDIGQSRSLLGKGFPARLGWALPPCHRRYRPAEFMLVKHLVLPVRGMLAIGVPVYYLCKPGQEAPYSWFPYAALCVLMISVIYAVVLSRRDPGLGKRAGVDCRQRSNPALGVSLPFAAAQAR